MASYSARSLPRSVPPLERFAVYGPAGAPLIHAAITRAAGDALTEGISPAQGAIGTYRFRCAIQVRRVRPRVDVARLRTQFAAILPRDVTGASLTSVSAAVGGETREGGELHWWITVDGEAVFRSAWTLDRFNYALTEAIADATTWSPDTANPSSPAWDFGTRANAHPGGVATSRQAGNILLNVLRAEDACTGATVRIEGSPYVRACTRAARIGPAPAPDGADPAPTPPPTGTPQQPPTTTPTSAARWIAGGTALAAGVATVVCFAARSS